MALLFEDKTRWQHFLYAIPIAVVFTLLCVMGAASALEFKDWQWGGTPDWKDWACTMLGGVIGQLIQVAIVLLII